MLAIDFICDLVEGICRMPRLRGALEESPQAFQHPLLVVFQLNHGFIQYSGLRAPWPTAKIKMTPVSIE